jgi:hydroxylamine reductase (hybrid-cluster protein)
MSDTCIGDCSYCEALNVDLAWGQEKQMCVGCREEANEMAIGLEHFALLKAAEPLVAYLKKGHNPHKIVIVSCDSVELLGGELNIPDIQKLKTRLK